MLGFGQQVGDVSDSAEAYRRVLEGHPTSDDEFQVLEDGSVATAKALGQSERVQHDIKSIIALDKESLEVGDAVFAGADDEEMSRRLEHLESNAVAGAVCSVVETPCKIMNSLVDKTNRVIGLADKTRRAVDEAAYNASVLAQKTSNALQGATQKAADAATRMASDAYDYLFGD